MDYQKDGISHLLELFFYPYASLQICGFAWGLKEFFLHLDFDFKMYINSILLI